MTVAEARNAASAPLGYVPGTWADPAFDWTRLPVEHVPLASIRPSKLAPPWWALAKVLLVMGHVLKPRSGDHFPHVVQAVSGEPHNLFVEDGHHRLTVLSLLGRRTVRVRVDRSIER
jgi:hypothetical protein